MVQDARRNFWKLKDFEFSPTDNIFSISKKLEVPPVLIIRSYLKNQGYSKSEINKILRKELETPLGLEDQLQSACLNDPVYSPLGLDLAKQRGLEGENIIKLWLISRGLKFQQDLRSDVSFPDFLLEKAIEIFNSSIIWIESKCYFGGELELIEDEIQFQKFDTFGKGLIIYWFGYEKKSNRFILSGEEFKKILPNELKQQVDALLNYIPKEFLHLIK